VTQPPEQQPPTQRAPHNQPPQQAQPPTPPGPQSPQQPQPANPANPYGGGQQWPVAPPPNPYAGAGAGGAGGGYAGYGGTPSPYQPKKGGSGKTIAIVVAVIVLVVLLFCGGIIGLIIWAANNVEDEFDEFESDRVGGPDNPITVTEGESFEIDGIEYADGWRIVPAADDTSQDAIVGLQGENDRSDESSENVSLQFTFVTGDTEVGSLSCYSDGPISYGNTEELNCSAYDAIPDSYDGIEVSASY
jgi:hypothetical protein